MEINSPAFYMSIQSRIQNGGERMGQAYYNAAFGLQPRIVANTPQRVDPFYDDSKCEAFIDWVREQLNGKFEISPRQNVSTRHFREIGGKIYMFRHTVDPYDARTCVYLLDENRMRKLVKVIVWYSKEGPR